jgi:hypothetical protein
LLTPVGPAQIEEFLRSYWRDVVQARISRAGEDSAPTVEACSRALILGRRAEARTLGRAASGMPPRCPGW